MQQLKIEVITPQSFAPFGKVLEFSENKENSLFEIIENDEENPWRLAVYRVINRESEKLECHPTSKESFTPLSGTGVIIVAQHDTPEDMHLFLLNKPICLDKGVWHGCITLSEQSVYEITENLEVESVFHNFKKTLSINLS